MTQIATKASASVMLDEALLYASYGWKVIILHGIAPDGGCTCKKGKQCGSAGKHPRPTAWQHEATDDEDKIIEWFERWPNSNVGVKLGDDSQIVDIECDSPEAEEELQKLFGTDSLITPTFKSSKGHHRLFLYDNELPSQAHFGWKQIDFKLGGGNGGTQSVFPPSKHVSGIKYEWVKGLSPSEVEPMRIPESVIIKIANLSNGGDAQRPSLDATEHEVVLAGERDNTLTRFAGKFRSFGLDAVEIEAALTAVNQRRCRPPLDARDIARIANSVARYAPSFSGTNTLSIAEMAGC